MPTGYMYILYCDDKSFYTGSTMDLDDRIRDHQDRKGARYTSKRLPVRLVYVERFDRIEDAFYREKQVQKWSRKKKLALISSNFNDLKIAARASWQSRESDENV